MQNIKHRPLCTYGILGAGRIAEKFAETFHAGLVHNAALVAVASTDMGRASAFAQTYEIPKSYGSYQQLLHDPDIDLVYIAVTNNAHFRCCMDAISAGKGILCEKPLVLTQREAVQLTNASKDAGVFLMEAMWSRFLPAIQKAAQWVSDGRIGTMHYISAGFCAARDPNEYQRLYDPSMGGGAFFDLGIYPLSLVQYLAGNRRLVRVVPMSVPTGTGVDASTFLNLLYEDGLSGEIKCSITFDAPNEAWVIGDRGWIRIAPDFHFAQRVELFTEPISSIYDGDTMQPQERYTHRLESGFEFEISHTADCWTNGLLESPVMPLSQSVQTAQIFDLVQVHLKSEENLRTV